jgi:pyruvate dehydrogenase E1 component
LGGTAGRTTLNGEGLQHEDGHSHLLSSTIPNCISYDPTFAYELAIIIQDGLRRMYQEQEDVFYYITVMNENYNHPELPKGVEDGVVRGMYKLPRPKGKKASQVQLLGSGTILLEIIAAQKLLKEDFNIVADVWSCTSFNELRRDGISTARWNMLHPDEPKKRSYVEQCLSNTEGPVIAATDYMRIFADQIRPYIPNKNYDVLGTDGFGRSDTREKLRDFFEVDRRYVVVAALSAMLNEGTIPKKTVIDAIKKYGVNPNKPEPTTV